VGEVGAVVVGGDYQGLGIVRSVGRAGAPVCVVDDERSIARFSRYATSSVRVGELRDERATVDALLELGGRLGLQGWVLFPTREETVAAFSRHRDELGEVFRVSTPPWDVVRWAWDKRNTYALAERLGIPTPRTWYPATEDELPGAEAVFPLAIKPAIKENFIYATKAKAWRADDRAELVDLYRRARDLCGDGEVMIQELIPGDGRHQFAYGAFFKDGRALGLMVARRRRQHPPEFGRASTYVETIELPELEQLSERFLREIDYYGLVELEYKLDDRSGEHKLLDVNARTWGYHTLGMRAGVDFPMMLFADQLGRPVEPRHARPGVRWVRLATDIPTAAVELARGRLDLRAYIRSLGSVDEEAVFSRRDPLPGLVEVALIPYLSVKRGF
jgi:predicted ATP-grasp superfamily ATP-dependent carboligase